MPHPLQNRVTPEGEIVAVPARGTVMGNRGGCLHRPDKTLGSRRWASRQWICCVLDFKSRQRQVMAPGQYTELFFLDEATALAAGHRPCFECRRQDAVRFAALWAQSRGLTDRPRAPDIDRILHAERLDATGHKRTTRSNQAALPDGTFVRTAGGPALVWRTHLLTWSPEGYHGLMARDREASYEVLTPPGIVAVLKLGYCPIVHETIPIAR